MNIQVQKYSPAKKIFFFLLTLIGFLISIKVFGDSLKLFGKDTATFIISSIDGPIVGLFVGILATAIIQSSSTSTSIVVTLVASGALTIEMAIPIIMGANVGTSVTSTILAYAHVGRKKEFKRAVVAATMHDFFNILVTLILFPIEYFFHFLSFTAKKLSHLFAFAFDSDFALASFIELFTKRFFHLGDINPWILFTISLISLYACIRGFAFFLKKFIIGRTQKNLSNIVFKNHFYAMGWGIGITTLVQSSSVTTSLIVPFVASNKITTKKVFPFLLGANIGTTITAILAALIENEAALTVAFVHLLFNLLGAFLFYPIGFMRNIPVRLAKKLGKASAQRQHVGIAYLIVTFFALPFIVFYFAQLFK